MSIGNQPRSLRVETGTKRMPYRDALMMDEEYETAKVLVSAADVGVMRALSREDVGYRRVSFARQAEEKSHLNPSASRLRSMSKMSPTGLRGLLKGMQQKRLDRLVMDSLIPSAYQSHKSAHHVAEVSGIEALLSGVLGMDCLQSQAAAFHASVRALNIVPAQHDRLPELLKLAGALFRDRAGAFVGALREREPQCDSLMLYLKLVFRQPSPDTKEVLKSILSELMHGQQNDSFAAYMQEPEEALQEGDDEDEFRYSRAANLGYITGATQIALQEAAPNRREQAALLNTIFLGAMKAGGGVTGQARKGKANSELEKLGFHYIISEIDQGDLRLLDGLYNLAFPRNEKGRPLSHEAGPGAAFKYQFDSVVLGY